MKLLFLLLIGFIIISCSDESSKAEIYGCPEECQEWERCDLVSYTCKLDQTTNSCNRTSECDFGYIWNGISHKL